MHQTVIDRMCPINATRGIRIASEQRQPAVGSHDTTSQRASIVVMSTGPTVLVVVAVVMLCPTGPPPYAAVALADTAYDRWFAVAG